MSILYETMIGRLGSRFCMNFRPGQKCVYISPLGRFYDKPFELSLGISLGNMVRILPLSEEYPEFTWIDQDISPTSVRYNCWEPEYGIRAQFEFISPFYPKDEKLSIAPLFYIKVHIENIGNAKLIGDAMLSDGKETIDGKLFMEIEGSAVQSAVIGDKGFKFSMAAHIDPEHAKKKWLDNTRGKDFSSQSFYGDIGFFSLEENCSTKNQNISIPFSLKSDTDKNFYIVCAAYTPEKVLDIEGDLYRFKYTSYFSCLEDVVSFACMHKRNIIKKTRLFDSTFEQSTLDKTSTNLISFSLQSYLSNTWWMINENSKDWYSVWEGNCAYHSTICVEYNIALFYLMLWPELLEKTFNEWTNYEKVGGYMAHDMGKFLVLRGMEYSHDLEVEENTNYILMLHALYKYTGKKELVEKFYQQIVRLTEYIRSSDTTGNGFPNMGTANTVDDAGPAVQYSKEQTYLGIKALGALTATKEFAEIMHDPRTINLCNEGINLINKTLDEEAWLGDHYAVCIDKSSSGLKDVWTGKELHGEMPGWDAYSIYAGNGIFYLLLTNTNIDINLDRIKTDVKNATEKCLTRYGCTHSNMDIGRIVWISQNLWKDFVASYLGVDMLGGSCRYWDFEVYQNSMGNGGCFVDTALNAHLTYYPRGIVSIGLPYAMGGIQIDKVKKELRINPVRIPCRIPLFSFADWVKEIIPWVQVSICNTNISCNIENPSCIKGYDVYLFDKKI